MAGTHSRIRDNIIQAAVELFREQGYDNVSVNAICKRAYVAHSSFYYLFSGKQEIIECLLRDVRENEQQLTEALLFASNDFERMWTICCRYLDVALRLGPEITASLMKLELSGSLRSLEYVHAVDSWFIRFTENCLRQGIMRTGMPAEFVAVFGIDAVYKLVYDWCAQKGAFNLRRRAREVSEALYDLAPEYRMSEQEKANL